MGLGRSFSSQGRTILYLGLGGEEHDLSKPKDDEYYI